MTAAPRSVLPAGERPKMCLYECGAPVGPARQRVGWLTCADCHDRDERVRRGCSPMSKLPDIAELAAGFDAAATPQKKLDAVLAIAYGIWQHEAWWAATPYEPGDNYMIITSETGLDTADGRHYRRGETIRVRAADRKKLLEAGMASDIIGGVLPQGFNPLPKGVRHQSGPEPSSQLTLELLPDPPAPDERRPA